MLHNIGYTPHIVEVHTMEIWKRDLLIIVEGSLTNNNTYGIMFSTKNLHGKSHFFGNVFTCGKDRRISLLMC